MSFTIALPESTTEQSHLTPGQQEGQALIRLLSGVMALGQMCRMSDEVEKILTLLSKMVDERQPLLISLAIAAAVMGDGSVAKALLRDGVDHWSNPENATVSLATALQLVGDLEWKEHIERLLATTSDPGVREIAQNMLEVEGYDMST